jgi:hypothetical protein
VHPATDIATSSPDVEAVAASIVGDATDELVPICDGTAADPGAKARQLNVRSIGNGHVLNEIVGRLAGGGVEADAAIAGDPELLQDDVVDVRWLEAEEPLRGILVGASTGVVPHEVEDGPDHLHRG